MTRSTAESLKAVTRVLERGRPATDGKATGSPAGQRRVGQQTLRFPSGPRVVAAAAVAGPDEGRGPLGAYWDRTYKDRLLGQKSWERAERQMCLDAAYLALEKAGLKPADVDLHLGGDLMNQLTCANFAAVELDIPFVGLFAACATWGEELALAAMATEGGFARRVLCTTSSHHDTAERQYRFPTELGNQKPACAQWTATGAAAVIVAAADDDAGTRPAGGNARGGGSTRDGTGTTAKGGPVRITHATFGRVIDMGLTDPMNMGAAMAPAAADTIRQHLQDTRRKPGDYDLIVTGDLARYGQRILVQMLREQGYDAEGVLADCGILLYDASQGVYAGGSGTACSAMVMAGYLLRRLETGDLRRILLVCTGCLHSTTTYKQGESLPTVAHAVVLEGAG